MEYISSYGTMKNNKRLDKPNEDYVLCDDERKVYILLDGVSRDAIDGKYPNPSPAREASEIFAKTVYDFLKDKRNAYDLIQIKEAFIKGNEAVRKYNSSYNGEFLPGTVGIVCVINEENLFYGYIGDCYGRLIGNNGIQMFTCCQTKEIMIHKKEFTAYEIRNEICNNIEHPFSYGVITGQEEALDFVVLGQKNLKLTNKIILSSDGLEPYLSGLSAMDFKSDIAENYLEKSINGSVEDDKSLIIIDKK